MKLIGGAGVTDPGSPSLSSLSLSPFLVGSLVGSVGLVGFSVGFSVGLFAFKNKD